MSANPENKKSQGRIPPPAAHRFQPGISGNPAGRPKSSLAKALAEYGERKQSDGRTACQALAATAWRKAIGGDIAWAEWIGDRLLGKPPQVISAEGGTAARMVLVFPPEAKA